MTDIKINMSVFIPHVFTNFTKKYVADAFADVGVVDRVDFVAKQDCNGKPYNSAYIHFKSFEDNNIVEHMQWEINEYGEYHMYHDSSKYYWIVLPNNAKKYVTGQRKERIDLNGAKAVNATPEPKPVCNQEPVSPKKKPTYVEKLTQSALQKLNESLQPIVRNMDKEAFQKCVDDLKQENTYHFETETEAEMAELEAEMAELDEMAEIDEMAELEAELAEEDRHLVSIDCRYVQMIEYENIYLHREIERLQTMLAEKA